jgi:hypothetical protein
MDIEDALRAERDSVKLERELDKARHLMDRYHSALLMIYQHGRTIDDARETARVALEQSP